MSLRSWKRERRSWKSWYFRKWHKNMDHFIRTINIPQPTGPSQLGCLCVHGIM
jgi:hypothetical protein